MNSFALAVQAALLLCIAGTAAAGPLEITVLDKDGRPTPNAVVVVLASGSGSPAAPREMVINQQNMRFQPAVSLVAVGAKARFVNNDAWEHHVRSSAAGATQFGTEGGFELRLDGKVEGKPAKSAEAVFDKAGPVLLGCHLHSSMRGFVYVTDSPWAGLTGTDGAVTLQVPNGPATIKVWHADQLIDIAPQQTAVTDAPAKATMQLSIVPRGRRI
ncbi:MAG: plastocyanin [Comamonadaceae bacterium]|nr:MAG: plastocyanin [Comamonadaceae bacterium]